jgi:hypothetical protein
MWYGIVYESSKWEGGKNETRNRDHLHRPPASFQKRAYADIKIFSSLPSNLRSLMNKQTQFKVALKRYLNTHSFYSVEEFLTFRNDS